MFCRKKPMLRLFRKHVPVNALYWILTMFHWSMKLFFSTLNFIRNQFISKLSMYSELVLTEQSDPISGSCTFDVLLLSWLILDLIQIQFISKLSMYSALVLAKQSDPISGSFTFDFLLLFWLILNWFNYSVQRLSHFEKERA